MKGLAWALWLSAIAILVCILQMSAVTKPHSAALGQVERSLLAIAPPTVVLAQEPAPAAAIIDSIAGCSKLGVFPRREWAERVATILTDAAPSTPIDAVVESSRIIEEVATVSWQVQKISSTAYYLRFDAWSLDELARRMTLQRDLLKKLLSITAIPEAC
ncbi:MAG: hypothetical protein V4730_12110 [Pseudomonadota bacterium]